MEGPGNHDTSKPGEHNTAKPDDQESQTTFAHPKDIYPEAYDLVLKSIAYFKKTGVLKFPDILDEKDGGKPGLKTAVRDVIIAMNKKAGEAANLNAKKNTPTPVWSADAIAPAQAQAPAPESRVNNPVIWSPKPSAPIPTPVQAPAQAPAQATAQAPTQASAPIPAPVPAPAPTQAQAPAQNPRRLSLDQSRETLKTFELKFNSPESQKFHQGVEWIRVKAALIADPEAIWSIKGMEDNGHKPDIYFADEKGFDIGTCSAEVPEYGKGCIYDEDARKLLNPGEKFNGKDIVSAAAMARELGIDLMSLEQRIELQKNGKFDMKSYCWLKTDASTRNTGQALFASCAGVSSLWTKLIQAHAYIGHRGWRGTRRVKWAT